jgi:hypothetical protein
VGWELDLGMAWVKAERMMQIGDIAIWEGCQSVQMESQVLVGE